MDKEIVTEYRGRFPEETQRLTDNQLTAAVNDTEDDMDDAEWREYFTNYKAA